MKKYYFILLIQFTVCGLSQAQSVLDQLISISLEESTIEDGLFQLIDLNIPVSFSNRIIPSEPRLSIVFEEQPLRAVLDAMFENTELKYQTSGNQIIITRKPRKKYTISGYIRDIDNGENIIGAIIYIPAIKAGTYTNEYGYYSLTVESDTYKVMISSLGFESIDFMLDHSYDRQLDLELHSAWLAPVIVQYYNDSNFVNKQQNTFDINMKLADRMTALGGESDLVRTVLTLPGIQSGADGFGGLSVRGGDIDQNLFLLDGVPVYNAMHGLGLFSIYNSSAIRDAKVLKGSFPARYGGRMSSVWDVQTKEGSKKEFKGELDLGVTSVKLTMEAPLIKDRASFFFSGRRALFDFYAEPISRKLRDNGGFVTYHFDDINMKVNYDLSKNDRLYLSYYAGNDTYDDLRILKRTFSDSLARVRDREVVDWGNRIAALRWNHVFSNKVFGNTTLTYSNYRYSSSDLVDLLLANEVDTLSRDIILQLYASEIRDYSIKTDLDYTKIDKHKIKFGGQFTRHEFSTKITTFEEASNIDFINTDTIGDSSNLPLSSTEIDVYVEDEIEFNKYWKANIGLRVATSKVLDRWFVLPQPRLLATYTNENKLSFDFSVTRMTQFLHLISPSRLGLPKDLWVTSTNSVPPQDSWQFAMGVNKKLSKGFSIDVDFYYKKLYNQIILKDLIENLNSTNWQDKVAIGTGQSYGAEILIQKQAEKWTGWLSYTLGWSNRKFSDDINLGESFPIKLDRRHNLNIQGTYRLNDHWDFSMGYIVASGSFYSLPTQEYTFVVLDGFPVQVNPILIQEGFNDLKLAPYHRLDIGANYKIQSKTLNHSLKLGVSNLYNRLNPLFRTIRDQFEEDGVLSNQVVEVSLLPIFPSLRYIVELR